MIRINSGYLRKCTIFLVLLTIFILPSFSNPDSTEFKFEQLPDLPSSKSDMPQLGLAGGFAGVHNGIMIFAGGANFPDDPPWKGGSKKWWEDIYVLKHKNDDGFYWLDKIFKLPEALAYGVSVSTDDGVVIIGGCNANSCSNRTYLISWIKEEQEINIIDYPSLPVPLANMTGCIVNDAIYIAGGQENMSSPTATKHFFRLDLKNINSDSFDWEILPSWHGEARGFAVSANQSNGVDNCFYMFSGRNYSPDDDVEILQDAYCFNPRLNKWTIISNDSLHLFPVMAGTAFSSGVNHVIFLGGSDGIVNACREKLTRELTFLKASGDNNNSGKIEILQREIDSLFIYHPGFSTDILAFNTITKQVFKIGEMPFKSPVTTSLVQWGKNIILPGGEIKPGVRTPKVWKINLETKKKKFGIVNTIVLISYFLILIGIGFYFSKRQKSTFDYFKGGKRIPWWVTGLSLFGTALSAITFIAIPAKSFATDWGYIFLNVGILLIAPVVIYFFIPFYRRLNVVTAYEYLEKRFNVFIRLLGSISFILFHIGRIGIVLYLPSIALNVATGIDIMTCILAVGIISMLYTIIGGIEAVIWTDALQVVVLLGGAIFCILLISFSFDNGFSNIWHEAVNDNKLRIFDLAFDLKNPTFLVVLVGGFFAQFIVYCTDQTMVQRYMTQKTRKETNKSVLLNAVLTIPATLIFFFIGTALYVFYKNFPTQMNLNLTEGDAIFPWYIFNNLPAGISGLLISGILAAAMSTLSSSINSGATAYFTDIHKRLNITKHGNSLAIARVATFFMGLFGVLFAVMLANMEIKSLWDEFQKVLGLIIGGLGGVFILGIFSRRANSFGALVGIVGSAIVQYFVSLYQPVHLLLYTATGVISCVILGLLASLFSKPKENIDHLVIYSLMNKKGINRKKLKTFKL